MLPQIPPRLRTQVLVYAKTYIQRWVRWGRGIQVAWRKVLPNLQTCCRSVGGLAYQDLIPVTSRAWGWWLFTLSSQCQWLLIATKGLVSPRNTIYPNHHEYYTYTNDELGLSACDPPSWHHIDDSVLAMRFWPPPTHSWLCVTVNPLSLITSCHIWYWFNFLYIQMSYEIECYSTVSMLSEMKEDRTVLTSN